MSGVLVSGLWYWPDPDALNDFPDPMGIEDEWHSWPGTMESGPSVHAEIFSREYIQNSWDSIQTKMGKLGDGSDAAPQLHFRFVELSGKSADSFSKNFGLTDHISRLAYMKANSPNQFQDNRLGDSPFVSGDLSHIRLLIAVEHVGNGMPGRWTTLGMKEVPPSLLKYALVQSSTGKEAGSSSGGSWGHGKRAIAAASSIRVLGTYTCHPFEPGDDPGVTRRFLGTTYWRRHESENRVHRGLGLAGTLSQDDSGKGGQWSSFEPFTNESADAFVSELQVPGLNIRDVANVDDHGSTYFFLEPSFTAAELAWAIERNWWPLLIDRKLPITVTDFDGSEIPINPSGRQELIPFTRAFEVARKSVLPKDEYEQTSELKAKSRNVGPLAVAADLSQEGWSYEVVEGGTNLDIIALVRNDMVIAYQQFPLKNPSKVPPFIRGVLIVDRESPASVSLKMTEGHLHNAWRTDKSSVGDSQNAEFAKSVLEKVNEKVREFRSKIRPKTEKGSVDIRTFREIFGAGKGGVTPTGEPGKNKVQRDFTIQGLAHSVVDYDATDPTRLWLRSTAQIGVRKNHDKEAIPARISLGWAVLEDSPVREDELLGEILENPSEFVRQGNFLFGTLTKTPVTFTWTSKLFVSDWQVVPDPQVKSLAELGEGVESGATS
jgi:hypothetical protein